MSPFWILSELRVMEVVSGDNWSYKTCSLIQMPPPRIQRNSCQLKGTAWNPVSTQNCSSLSILTAIFRGEPGLAGFIRERDDESGDNWSCKSCKAPVKPSPSTNQHPVFTGRMTFLSPTNGVRALKIDKYFSMAVFDF